MDTPELPGAVPSEAGPDSGQHLPHPQNTPDRLAGSARWAPWWVYLGVLLGANYLRAGLLPVGTLPEPAVVVLALVQAAVLFAVVTAGWRFLRRVRGTSGTTATERPDHR